MLRDISNKTLRSDRFKNNFTEKRDTVMVKMILDVDGMACGMCEAHVNDAVRKGFQVKKPLPTAKELRKSLPRNRWMRRN